MQKCATDILNTADEAAREIDFRKVALTDKLTRFCNTKSCRVLVSCADPDLDARIANHGKSLCRLPLKSVLDRCDTKELKVTLEVFLLVGRQSLNSLLLYK